MKNLIVFDRRL